jgi:hypothetical protein
LACAIVHAANLGVTAAAAVLVAGAPLAAALPTGALIGALVCVPTIADLTLGGWAVQHTLDSRRGVRSPHRRASDLRFRPF